MHSLTLEDLGKRYITGRIKAPPPPRRVLAVGRLRVLLPRLPRWGGDKTDRELWALRHVSLDVPRGTILGIIGSNGAGKSTLLKVIARVTPPTEGRVIGRGRVVSLLELGAGFNPDFTARENILMHAAMQGISKADVLQRLDDIVAFAEVERFLDSPVRHFSSGMFLRLAFSVAINLRPDILLADEILAVGDIAFQERCLQRIAEEAKNGLTVLFVSHDMAALARLCDRVMWLDRGELKRHGAAAEVVAEYQGKALEAPAPSGVGAKDVAGTHANLHAEIASVRLVDANGDVIGAAPAEEDVAIRVRLKVRRPDVAVRCSVDLQTRGILAFRSVQPDELVAELRGVYDVFLRIPARFLSETTYTASVGAVTRRGKELDMSKPNALTFLVYGSGDAGAYKKGIVSPHLEWNVVSHAYAAHEQPVA